MEHAILDRSITAHLPKLITEYLDQSEVIQPFAAFAPNLEGLKEAVAARAQFPVDRKTLVEVLKDQHAAYEGNNAKLREHLFALEHEKTFTVTTGHQVCLFTGPLYFIYKIISTVRLAEELNHQMPDCRFVPVFWMATEDHDFEEINHVHVYGKTISWDREAGGAVGRMPTQDVEPMLDELRELLSREERMEEVLTFFREAYLGRKNLAEATRMVVQELFAADGVVVIDADDTRLKKNFTPVMKADLTERNSESLILESSQKLQDLGYKTPVMPRPINFFYLTDGSRERFEWTGEAYQVLNTDLVFTEEELLAELEAHPERFSPNVAMRPQYQECILPNVAYLGGPSEAAYWLQLKSSFEAQNTFFPVVLPRNFAMVLDKGTLKRMSKLDLKIEDLYGDLTALIAAKVKEGASNDLEITAEKEAFSKLYSELIEKAMVVDPSLKGAAEADKQRMLKGLDNLENKMLKAEKRKQETQVNQITALHGKLFPGGVPQERWENIIPFYLRWGNRFIHDIKRHFNPLDQRMNVFMEED